MGQFSAGPNNKGFPSFLQIAAQEYANGVGRHSEHFSLLKKVFALTAFARS